MSDTLQSEESAIQQIVGGRYQIIRLLGKGGMGSVFAARNTWTRRQVALKMLHPEAAANSESVQRFMVEARAAAKIKHPNILDVLDMGRDEASGAVFLITEFLEGEDLARLLKARGSLPPREAVEILLPVVEALVAAHDLGIIHRDLKPENIFLAATAGRVTPKVIDFGISKVLDAKTSGMPHTRTGTVLGTPFYMSPEQAQGDAVVDVRTDVWSLGVVLFEALSAKRPYVAPNYNALVARLLLSEPLRLDAVAPDLPPDLVAAVHGALQRDPDRRFPTMRAFLDALRACAVAADIAPGGTGARPSRDPDDPAAGRGARCSPTPQDTADAMLRATVVPAGASSSSADGRAAPWESGPVGGVTRRRRAVLVGTAAGVALVTAVGVTLVLKPGVSESRVATHGEIRESAAASRAASSVAPSVAPGATPEALPAGASLADARVIPVAPARGVARPLARPRPLHGPPARAAAPSPPLPPQRRPEAPAAAPLPSPGHGFGANHAPRTDD